MANKIISKSFQQKIGVDENNQPIFSDKIFFSTTSDLVFMENNKTLEETIGDINSILDNINGEEI